MRTELVTTLKRKATEIIADPESEQQPVLITQNGKPAAYLTALAKRVFILHVMRATK